MTSFRIFLFGAFSLLCVSVIPRMADRGMFLDGVTYAVLARNLAEGQGTLWHPRYTATVYPDFHEQPPIGIGLQALAFAVLGDHAFVERLFSFAVGVVTLGLLLWVWHAGRRSTEHREAAWLPAVLWITAPVVSWSLVNNMLEATQTVFTVGAVGAILESLRHRGGKRLTWASVSGLSVAVAALVKGPVGLFPLATPWVYGLVSFVTRASKDDAERRLSRVAFVAIVQLLGMALLLGAVLLYGPSRQALESYVAQQLRPTVTGMRETSGHRLRFAKTTAQEVLPMAILTGIAVLLARRRQIDGPTAIDRHRAATFLLLGCAATLPLAVSPKQSGHYVVPAIPMFALGFASLIASSAQALMQSARCVTWTRRLAVLLLGLTIAAGLVRWAVPWRDATRLHDLDRVFSVVPVGSTLHLCPQAQTDWSLHAYAQRYWRASLDIAKTPRHWGLAPVGTWCAVPKGCRMVPIGTSTLVLYECATAERARAVR